MSEFPGHNFGNLPPGCYESDPRAPWNEEDPIPPSEDVIMDEIYITLEKLGVEPDYKTMTKIRFWGGELEVKFT